MLKKKKNWRIYRSKSRGVMIEYHDLSGKLLLALNYQPEQARQLADQILSAVDNRQDEANPQSGTVRQTGSVLRRVPV